MKRQGSGSIIHNGSTAGITTDGSGPVYAASKAGVIHMTRIWATQLAEFGNSRQLYLARRHRHPHFLGRPPYPVG